MKQKLRRNVSYEKRRVGLELMLCRVGPAQYYIDDDCCGHYQNFRDVQLSARAHHLRYESLADTGPYHHRRPPYRTAVMPPECRCCPTPSRDLYYDQYAAEDMYSRHPYGPAPPIPARTPVLSVRHQTPYVEGRRPITSPSRPRPKTPFTAPAERRGWPGRDRCYSVFDDPRRAEFESTNPPAAAWPAGSCLLRRRADTTGFTDAGKVASLGHI